MNLITDPWIPVTWPKGSQSLVGLEELFRRADQIRDLSVKPHERIALLRLLVCITQAALDGPDDYSAWANCRREIPRRTKDYLNRWKAAFSLFGPGPRFLQVPGLQPGKADGEGNSATKLDLALATGHNATVFDNAGGSPRPQERSRLALALLTFQCFSPTGIIGAVRWNGKEIGKCTGRHAPAAAASMLHCFVLGSNLLETLHLNLLDRELVSDSYPGWGQPVWEIPVNTFADKAAIRNATMTYLGRLVPLSRLVRLVEDGEQITLGNGLEYPFYPSFREPAATLVERKEGLGVLSANLERSLWRQLPAITVRERASKELSSGPMALSHVSAKAGATLWLGALVSNKAKIEDVVEAIYQVPAGMFQNTGRQVFEKGVALAEAWEHAVGACVKTYAEGLKLQPVPYDRARRYFWTAVEQHVPVLLALTDNPALAADLAATEWGRAVRSAAAEALEHACPHQTPRQIEAFAQGRQRLFLPRSSAASGQAQTKQVKTHSKQ